MALDDILAAIDAEADEESNRIIADAQRRAEVLLREAQTEAEAEVDRLAHSKDDVAATATRRVTSRAHLAAERARRVARESVYTEALARAAEKLSEVRGRPDHEEILERLIAEALAAVPDATVARVSAEDVATARSLLIELGSAAEVEPGVRWGGVVLLCDGLAVHNDLPSRLERADRHLRFIAADIFPELRGEAP